MEREAKERCPDENELVDFLLGSRGEVVSVWLESHIDRCADCRALLVSLAAVSWGDGWQEGGDTPSVDFFSAREQGALSGQSGVVFLSKGTVLGRYVLLEPVGVGGMGVVYVAYDPELERKVAIKLMHTRGSVVEAERSGRLMREAQAMAKLSHRHVITVFDLGVYEGQIFLAMEYLKGETLRDWLRREGHTWRERLERFLEAGEGLAAAHAAGLVHRDFKPENVLVSEEGVLKVTDFGLVASLDGDEREDREDEVFALGRAGREVRPLWTRTGALLGTPAYMSPEQLRGERGDAHSDQFSFCVSMWEAMCGVRPFGGESVEQRLRAIEGQALVLGSQTGLPHGLIGCLRRGLQEDPTKRFESMEALNDALRRAVTPPRRLVAVGLVLLMFALFWVVAWGWRGPLGKSPCAGAAQKLDGIWDAASRRHLREVFLKKGGRHGVGSWRRVRRTVDEFVDEWKRGYGDICGATYKLGEQSERLFDLRMDCLEGCLGELKAFVGLLKEGEPGVLVRAVSSSLSLGSVSRCGKHRVLLSNMKLPETSKKRAQVKKLRALLGRAKALAQGGKLRMAAALVRGSMAQIQRVGYRPLEAEARYLEGNLSFRLGKLKKSSQQLRMAIWAAQAGRHERLETLAWGELTTTMGKRSHHSRARIVRRHMKAMLERLGGDPELRLQYFLVEGLSEFHQGHYSKASKVFRLGLFSLKELRRSRDGKEKGAIWRGHRLMEARLLHNLALCQLVLERVFAAYLTVTKSLFLQVQLLGKGHPELAETLGLRGEVLFGMGRVDEAKKTLRRALLLKKELLGEGHYSYAHSLGAFTLLYAEKGQTAQALAGELRVFRTLKESLGEAHPYVGISLTRLGHLYAKERMFEKALGLYLKSFAIFRTRLGPKHMYTGLAAFFLAQRYLALGRSQKALQFSKMAVRSLRRSPGLRHPFALLAILLNERCRGKGKAGSVELKALQSVRIALKIQHARFDRAFNQLRIELGQQAVSAHRLGEARGLFRRVWLYYQQSPPKDLTSKAQFAFVTKQLKLLKSTETKINWESLQQNVLPVQLLWLRHPVLQKGRRF